MRERVPHSNNVFSSIATRAVLIQCQDVDNYETNLPQFSGIVADILGR